MRLMAQTKRKFLIVDDSRTMRALLEIAFEKRNDFIVVGIAPDATTAVGMVRDLAPDVITIDLCMPYIDGQSLLEMLSEIKNLCKVVVSDQVNKNIKLKNKLEESGAHVCLSKSELIDDSARFFDKFNRAYNSVSMRLALPQLDTRRSDKPIFLTRNSESSPAVNTRFPMPFDENERLVVLRRKHLANAVRERQFDLITQYVAQTTDFPVGLITFIDSTTQWIKSSYGLDANSMPRSEAFCNYTISQDSTIVVTNAASDPRFYDNPLVTGDMRIRTYVGHPIIAADGTHLGAVCVIDTKSRAISKTVTRTLSTMSQIVAEMIEQRPLTSA